MSEHHHTYNANGIEVDNRALINRIITLLIQNGESLLPEQLERMKSVLEKANDHQISRNPG